MAVKPIPEGYPQVSPYLIVPDVPRLIDFLTQAFGATEIQRHEDSAGAVAHAEVRIGDSVIMMGGTTDQWPPFPGAVYVYVEDVDAAYRRALETGATSLNEPADQFYGDRCAGVKDTNGNMWFIGTRIEDLSKEEMARRNKVEMEKRAQAAAKAAPPAT
ncbi:MAG: VOC family protein [Luteitalea sp.]|nr:VOC family protein [Luteitalea sp.]